MFTSPPRQFLHVETGSAECFSLGHHSGVQTSAHKWSVQHTTTTYYIRSSDRVMTWKSPFRAPSLVKTREPRFHLLFQSRSLGVYYIVSMPGISEWMCVLKWGNSSRPHAKEEERERERERGGILRENQVGSFWQIRVNVLWQSLLLLHAASICPSLLSLSVIEEQIYICQCVVMCWINDGAAPICVRNEKTLLKFHHM